MEENELLKYVLTILGCVISYQFNGIRSDFSAIKDNLKIMTKSIDQLNVEIKEVVTNQSWHKEEIIELKRRINAIEGDK